MTFLLGRLDHPGIFPGGGNEGGRRIINTEGAVKLLLIKVTFVQQADGRVLITDN